MADPTPPTTESIALTKEQTAVDNAAAEAKRNLADSTGKANTEIWNYQNTIKQSQESLSKYEQGIKSIGLSFEGNTEDIKKQVERFGLLSAAVLGARVSFENLGVNIDNTNLNTFTSQYKDLMTEVKNSPMGDAALKLKDALNINIGGKVGEEAKNFILNTAGAMITAADNGLKLGNTYMQLSTRTGEFDDNMKDAGSTLGNMNEVLGKQQALISGAAAATGLNTEQVEKYWAQLGNVPGALKNIDEATGKASTSTNILADVIKVAGGTGLPVSEIIKDMGKAFQSLGITGQPALEFSTRITNVAQTLGVNLDSAKTALYSTAEAFRSYARGGNEAQSISEGLAASISKYSLALQGAGVSQSESLVIGEGMVKQMGAMTQAQKMFLSERTGGASGGQGFFQMEKQMREDPKKVMDKIMQDMTKQFGHIVSSDEAASGGAAGNQGLKQIALLKSGAYGGLAKTDEQAMGMMDMLKGMQEGKAPTKELAKDPVKDAIEKGASWQEKSHTELTTIRSLIQTAQGQANLSNLGVIQRGLTTSTGEDLGATNNEPDFKTHMRDWTKRQESSGADFSNATPGTILKQVLSDIPQAMGDTVESVKHLGITVKDVFASTNPEKQYKMSEDFLKVKRDEANKLGARAKVERLDQIGEAEAMVHEAYGVAPGGPKAVASAAHRRGSAATGRSADAQRDQAGATGQPERVIVDVIVSDERIVAKHRTSPHKGATAKGSGI